MPVVLGVGGVLGIAMGFIGFDGGTESEPIPEPEEKVYVAPPPIDLTKKKEEVTEEVEVKKTPRTSVDGNAAGTKNLIENISFLIPLFSIFISLFSIFAPLPRIF